MHKTFPYRGPDDKGEWLSDDGKIGLGQRRLSILDISEAGHQPMVDEEEGLVIVFNGEIYNYIEIREVLLGYGYTFKSGTDTEVILKSYAHWGKDCLSRFNGMFAFAIWSAKEQSVFIARDRLGIKPLYYYETDDVFYFASEIKAILAALSTRPAIEECFVDAYMSFGYVPGSNTMLAGITRLLPGHFIVKSCRENIPVRPIKYWDLIFDNKDDKGEKFYLDESRRLLENAIDLRLRSDVPLGIFLSGGLDSSAVVGLLASRVNQPLKTFSVAYDFGSQFDETRYARIVSEKFKTEHHETIVTPRQFMDFIPEFIRLMDEPVTESAAISLYFVSLLAKEKVTVVLSGEGSDEIFAGYDLYRYMAVLERYHRAFGSKITGILASLGHNTFSEGHKIAKYLQLGAETFENRYKGISTYEESYKNSLYRDGYASYCEQKRREERSSFLAHLFEATAGQDVLNRMLYFDTKTWLVDDLLIKADRMSMAASLELRVPFLDYRLVEFAATIPSKYKVRTGSGKYLLKKMMEPILPRDIIFRKKMGFPTPLKIMFQGELYGYACDLLLSPTAHISSYFSRSRVEELLQEHKANKVDHHRLLWQLVVLEQWLQENK
jgi:asparagine synthase (glutamine-hydrolysing)